MSNCRTVYPPEQLPFENWQHHIGQMRFELQFLNGHCDYCSEYGLPVEHHGSGDEKIICRWCLDDQTELVETDTGTLWDIKHEIKNNK